EANTNGGADEQDRIPGHPGLQYQCFRPGPIRPLVSGPADSRRAEPARASPLATAVAFESSNGKATMKRTTFRLAIAVTRSIAAPATPVWNLLTDIGAQSRWNSTLTSIEGKIAPGERVSFRVPEAPGQTF